MGEFMRGKKAEVGERYNKLVILEIWVEKRSYSSKDRSYSVAKCKCDCGNITIGRVKEIRSNLKMSCGCLMRRKNEKSPNWKGCGEISGHHWYIIRRRSLKNPERLPFEITIEYAWEIFLKQNRKCALTGIEIYFALGGSENKKDGTASLDRIDSSKGYIPGNVQWVHKTINTIKWQLPEEDFIQWCKLVVNHHEEKLKDSHNQMIRIAS